MKIVTLDLGRDKIEVEFNYKVAQEWRAYLQEPLKDLLDTIRDAGKLSGIKIDNLDELIPQLQQVAPYVLDLPDRIAEILFNLGPLAAQRAELERTADDEQIIRCFVIMLRAAYPFSPLAELFNIISARNGRSEKTTSKS